MGASSFALSRAILREVPFDGGQQRVVGRQIVKKPAAEIDHGHADDSLEETVQGLVRQHGGCVVKDQLNGVALFNQGKIDLEEPLGGPHGVHEPGLFEHAVVEQAHFFVGRRGGHRQNASQPPHNHVRALLIDILHNAALRNTAGRQAGLDIQDHGTGGPGSWPRTCSGCPHAGRSFHPPLWVG